MMSERYETWWLPCDCTEHAISVSRWASPDDKNVYISMWGAYNGMADSWRERVRNAWNALRGNLYKDNVILDQKQAAALGVALQAAQRD